MLFYFFCDICHCPLCLASGLHPNPKTCFALFFVYLYMWSFLVVWLAKARKNSRERERNVFRVTLFKCSICFCFTCTENPISIFFLYLFFWRRETQKNMHTRLLSVYFFYSCFHMQKTRNVDTRRNYKLTQQQHH